MIRFTLAALTIASTVLTACYVNVAPDESTETVAESANEVNGPGACMSGETVCWMWSGQNQVYGTCSRGVCCTGCIDYRGVCRSGADFAACGNGGAFCESCEGSETCKPAGVCCPPVTIDPVSGLPVGKDCGQL
jgi:hypothetical protein